MSPVPYTWGPFLAKIFLKIDEIKIRPLTPPQNHFNTLPVLVADACIQEGWEKKQCSKKNENDNTCGPNFIPGLTKGSIVVSLSSLYDRR